MAAAEEVVTDGHTHTRKESQTIIMGPVIKGRTQKTQKAQNRKLLVSLYLNPD